MSDRNSRGGRSIALRFGDLRVRPKLMVLHNLFFLVLTVSVYFSLIPLVEQRLTEARQREVTLIVESFEKIGPADPPRGLGSYSLESGSADQLGMPEEARLFTTAHPGAVWSDEHRSEFLYKKDPLSDRFYRLHLPLAFYSNIVEGAKLAVFGVLGVSYILAVLLLELVIMPRYVYGPIGRLLQADEASRRGDRANEIIDPDQILGDEIGEIMASRNAAIRALRRREDDLEQAKRTLEAHDRLVSLGMLSAGLAHEMNTPLAVLHGSIEKMLEKCTEPATKDRLERMLRVTERLRSISAGLLDFARVRKPEFESVSIRPIIEEAWALVAIDEKAGAVTFRNGVPDEIRLTGNANQLVQVFVNLLRNSLNAVPEGAGIIEVRLRPASFEGRVAHSV